MSKQQNKKPAVGKSRSSGRNLKNGEMHPTTETWIITGILLTTFIAFFPSLNAGFVSWDDFGYIRDNPVIKDLSFSNLRHIFNIHTYVKGNYHPLTVLTYCLEYHFVKLNPFLYHLDNVLLHLLNVLGVYLFVRWLTKRFDVAAITSLLFAIHPLRVESVTWVSERKDVLYTFFFLAALCCYLFYVRKSELKFYIAALVLFLLSILSKGQAVVLAPTLLLIDFFLKRKFDKKVWLEKIPFFALAILWGMVAVSAQHTQLTAERLQFYTLPQRLMVACYGIIMYLYKLLVPLRLSCFYPYPAKIGGFFFIAPVIVFGLLLTVGLWLYKNGRSAFSNAVVFGSLFFLVTISIVLQLLPVGDAVIAERYTYIPYLGLFFIAANVYSKLVEQKNLKTIFAVGGSVYLICLLVLTFNQTKVWKDSRTLWSSVIENYPETSVAYSDRGLDYYETKEYDKALSDFNNAIRYKPDNHDAYNNRGLVYKMLEKYPLAITDFKKSFELSPDYFIAAFNCGLTYVDENKPDSAIQYFDIAIKGDPQNAEYHYNLGVAYAAAKNTQAAIDSYSKAIELKPNHEGAYNNRGFIYSGVRQYDLAIADFTRSIELNSNNPLAFANRSAAYYESKNYKAALADALTAKSLGNDMGEHYLEILRAVTTK